MKKKPVPAFARKLKRLRDELHLAQKEVADKAHITEPACRVHELGDHNPKQEILDRIAKVLIVRPEYLSAPAFRNRREFAYTLLGKRRHIRLHCARYRRNGRCCNRVWFRYGLLCRFHPRLGRDAQEVR